MTRSGAMLFLLVVASAALPVIAEQAAESTESIPRSLNARWQVYAGGNLTNFDTEASLASGSAPVGIIVRLEDDLGLASRVNTFVAGLRYRINPRHLLEFNYTDLSRSATRVIGADLEFGDVTFLAGANVASRFDIRLLKFKWKYDFSTSPELNAGLTVGLSSFGMDLGLQGEGEVQVGDDVVYFEDAEEAAELIAPVPVIGFYLEHAFSRKWAIRLLADALELSINGDSGRIVEASFNAEYAFTPLFALGFGIGNQDVTYRSDDQDGKALDVAFRIESFIAYANFSFGKPPRMPGAR